MKRCILGFLAFPIALVAGISNVLFVAKQVAAFQGYDWSVIEPIKTEPLDLPLLLTENDAEFNSNINYVSALPVKLLHTGYFHSDEVPYKSSEKWLGFFRVDSKYFLKSTQIQNQRIKGEELFNRRITTSTPQDSIFLLKGAKTLRTQEVTSVFDRGVGDEYKIGSCATQSKSFGLGGQFWWLCMENPSEDGFPQKGTALVLKKNGAEPQILRYLPDGCNDCGWSVSWVGDLDNDRNLDFLIDLSGHYNVSQPTLFLSSEATNGSVGIFASFRGVGC